MVKTSVASDAAADDSLPHSSSGFSSLFWNDDLLSRPRRSLSAGNLAVPARVAFDLSRPTSQEWILSTLARAAAAHEPGIPASHSMASTASTVVSSAPTRLRRSMSLDSLAASFRHEDSMEVHVRRKRREAAQRIGGDADEPAALLSKPTVRNLRLWTAESVDVGAAVDHRALDAWPRDSIRIARQRRDTLQARALNTGAPPVSMSAYAPAPTPAPALAHAPTAPPVHAPTAPPAHEVRSSDEFDDITPANGQRTIGRKDTFGRKAARKLKAFFAPNARATTPAAVSTMTIE